VVVFFHEFGADAAAWRKYLWFLPAEGWHVFTFDFRGSGGSETPAGHRAHKWVTAGEVWDADAALEVVRTRALREGWEVAGFGASRGGAAMLMAAVAHPWLRVMACEGVSSTLESVYWHLRRWARIYVPAWLLACIPGPGWRALAHLVVLAAESREGLRFPALAEHLRALHDRDVLFAYGTKDSLINEGHRQAVMAAFPGRKSSWLMPRVGHLAGPFQCRSEYRWRMLCWLESDRFSRRDS
jgi:pimeloyl-ACP methyl ester carboxylesterase